MLKLTYVFAEKRISPPKFWLIWHKAPFLMTWTTQILRSGCKHGNLIRVIPITGIFRINIALIHANLHMQKLLPAKESGKQVPPVLYSFFAHSISEQWQYEGT